MSGTRKVFGFLATMHLTVLLAGMIPGVGNGPWGKVMGAYARLTGAGSSFGFFSPNVGNQWVIEFKLHHFDGKEEIISLKEGIPSETAIRVGNMSHFFTRMFKLPKIRRSIAASLTAGILEQRPQVKKATFIAKSYRLASLNNFSRLKPRKISPVYECTFSRHPDQELKIAGIR